MSLEEEHARIALDLLDAAPVLAGKVFDGVVPSPTPPPPWLLVYSLVRWPDADEAAAANLGRDSITCEVEWYVHCVGSSATAARVMAGHARSLLLGQLPLTVPTGRSVEPIRQIDAQPPARDETTGTAFMDAVLVFATISVPA